MTGAPVPAGADCVLRQEDTESNGQTVTFHAPVEARANVCFAGEDIAPGKCLVPAGTRLDEVSLGLLAGQGVQTVTVYAKPRAALMPTGDELCSPETPLRPGRDLRFQRPHAGGPDAPPRCRAHPAGGRPG